MTGAKVPTSGRRATLRGLVAAASVLLPPSAGATAFPSRPVRIVVPFAPGGSPDFVARALGEQLGSRWPYVAVVENRPGVGGNLAGSFVARAQPDGHTLFVVVDSVLTGNVHLVPPAYDPQRDLAPVAKLGTLLSAIVVHPSVPARTLPEFLSLLRREPDRYSYGHSGSGSPQHLGMAMLLSMAGVEMTGVGYRGVGPTITDLIAGNVHALAGFTQSLLPHVQAGRLRLLAMGTAERVPSMPDVPTVAETLPGYRLEAWLGVFTTGRTPEPVLAQLEAEILRAVAVPALRDRLHGQGIRPDAAGRTALAELLRADTAHWGEVIRQAGIRPD